MTNAPLIHPYYDGTSTAYASSGVTSNVTVPMNGVPKSVMKTPSQAGGEANALTPDTYVAWYPVFAAHTAEQAEYAGGVLLMLVTLDGSIVGNVTPYRTPAEQSTNPVSCEGEAHVPCYVVGWFIPLGRLPAGQHRHPLPW